MSAPSSSVVSYLAVGVACLSLGVATWAMTSRPEPAAAAPPVCECDQAAMQARIEALRRRVDRAERLAASVPSTSTTRAGPRDAPPTGDGAGAEPEPEPAEPPAPRPTIARFEVPHTAISVSQDEEGGIVVVNTDPALVGQTLTVDAIDEDGNAQAMTIIVPPVQ